MATSPVSRPAHPPVPPVNASGIPTDPDPCYPHSDEKELELLELSKRIWNHEYSSNWTALTRLFLLIVFPLDLLVITPLRWVVEKCLPPKKPALPQPQPDPTPQPQSQPTPPGQMPHQNPPSPPQPPGQPAPAVASHQRPPQPPRSFFSAPGEEDIMVPPPPTDVGNTAPVYISPRIDLSSRN